MLNLLSSLSVSKNIKTEIHSAITWSVVLTSVQLGYIYINHAEGVSE